MRTRVIDERGATLCRYNPCCDRLGSALAMILGKAVAEDHNLSSRMLRQVRHSIQRTPVGLEKSPLLGPRLFLSRSPRKHSARTITLGQLVDPPGLRRNSQRRYP